MKKVFKNRRNEQGQAIVEMVVGLIGICTVMTGILFMTSIGNANVLTLITSRENADQEIGGIQPQYIADWNIWEIEYDDDNNPHVDYTVTAGVAPNSSDFSDPLGHNGTISVVGNSDFANDPLVIGSQQESIFLDASFLQGSTGSATPLQRVLSLEINLMRDFREWLGITNINLNGHVSNQVFMPMGLRGNAAPQANNP